MHFNRIETSATHAKYALHYSKETYELYPFKFEFQVLYDLIGTSLRISYKVINLDKDTIWFSLGAHPAFNVPFSKGGEYESYYLEFENEEPLTSHILDAGGYFDGGTQPAPRIRAEQGRHETDAPLRRIRWQVLRSVFRALSSSGVSMGSYVSGEAP